MDANAVLFINRVFEEAREGMVQDATTIEQLLEFEPASEEVVYLAARARRLALDASGGIARIAGVIDVDCSSCRMNCKFCSSAEAWGLVKESVLLSLEQAVAIARYYVEKNITLISLRGTGLSDIDYLCECARQIRAEVPGSYEICIDAGNLTLDQCQQCYEAGMSSATHSLRLREGTDTTFNPEVRTRVLQAIAESPLKLNTLVGPVGPEHTNAEIAANMAFACAQHPYSLGISLRVPFEGMPLDNVEMLPIERAKQLVAVLRLAAGILVPYMLLHPEDEKGLLVGANSFVVESGINPDDEQGATPTIAKDALRSAGYKPGILDCDPRFSKGKTWRSSLPG